MTQQELVDQTGLDRSASYISAIENGKTSPTLDELERLCRYFRLTVVQFIEEALNVDARAGGSAPEPEAAAPDDRMARALASLTEKEQALLLDVVELLRRHRSR